MASDVLLPQESDYTKGVLLWTARQYVEHLDNRKKHIMQKLIDIPASAGTTSAGGGHGTLKRSINRGKSDLSTLKWQAIITENGVKLRRTYEDKAPI